MYVEVKYSPFQKLVFKKEEKFYSGYPSMIHFCMKHAEEDNEGKPRRNTALIKQIYYEFGALGDVAQRPDWMVPQEQVAPYELFRKKYPNAEVTNV